MLRSYQWNSRNSEDFNSWNFFELIIESFISQKILFEFLRYLGSTELKFRLKYIPALIRYYFKVEWAMSSN